MSSLGRSNSGIFLPKDKPTVNETKCLGQCHQLSITEPAWIPVKSRLGSTVIPPSSAYGQPWRLGKISKWDSRDLKGSGVIRSARKHEASKIRNTPHPFRFDDYHDMIKLELIPTPSDGLTEDKNIKAKVFQNATQTLTKEPTLFS